MPIEAWPKLARQLSRQHALLCLLRSLQIQSANGRKYPGSSNLESLWWLMTFLCSRSPLLSIFSCFCSPRPFSPLISPRLQNLVTIRRPSSVRGLCKLLLFKTPLTASPSEIANCLQESKLFVELRCFPVNAFPFTSPCSDVVALLEESLCLMWPSMNLLPAYVTICKSLMNPLNFRRFVYLVTSLRHFFTTQKSLNRNVSAPLPPGCGGNAPWARHVQGEDAPPI